LLPTHLATSYDITAPHRDDSGIGVAPVARQNPDFIDHVHRMIEEEPPECLTLA
jgi:hypothetical protein